MRRRGVVLRPKATPDAVEIRYVERLRPLAPVTELVAAARRPGWRELERDAIEPFVTNEGEHAAQLTLRGTLDGAPAIRSLAFVFLDDYVARVAGLARAPDDGPRLVAQVHRLARLDAHLLGVRRRRYVYTPPDPAGWHGYLMPPFHAYYIPLDYPRDSTTIAVYPALPGTGDALVDAVLASGPRVARRDLGAPVQLAAGSGLSGHWYTVHREEHSWDLVVMGDDRYGYALAMRSVASVRERHAATFAAMARSIEPLPRPRASQGEAGAAAMLHWED